MDRKTLLIISHNLWKEEGEKDSVVGTYTGEWKARFFDQNNYPATLRLPFGDEFSFNIFSHDIEIGGCARMVLTRVEKTR